ncbi:hypothetical protein L211DRAFT_843269, partial [Terfezia boudieri ATCC MYA-4762]
RYSSYSRNHNHLSQCCLEGIYNNSSFSLMYLQKVLCQSPLQILQKWLKRFHLLSYQSTSNLSALAEQTQVGLLDNNNNPEDDPEEIPIDLKLTSQQASFWPIPPA